MASHRSSIKVQLDNKSTIKYLVSQRNIVIKKKTPTFSTKNYNNYIRENGGPEKIKVQLNFRCVQLINRSQDNKSHSKQLFMINEMS